MTETSLAARVVGGPAGLVRFLERLGPGFVRCGQILALQPDLVPPQFRDELLLELTAPSHPLPWTDVQALLSAELRDLDALFRKIDQSPLSHNGISQVHAAVTATGENVLIRFLLPGVRERASKDRRRARAFARLVPAERELIDELTTELDREFNLISERENILKLAAISEENPALQVPRVYPELSTVRVLTLENLAGIPLTAVLSPARRAAFRTEGFDFDAHTLAVNLIDGTIRQIFQRHFYCPDLHPLNVLLLPGNRFSFANFNRCEAVDTSASLIYARFLNDVFTTEPARLSRTFEDMLAATDTSSGETLRDDFIKESHEWLRTVPDSNHARVGAAFSSPLSNWLIAIIRVARRNGFTIRPEMLSVFRTLVAVETLAMRLDPAVHLQSTGAVAVKDIILDDVFDRVEPVRIRAALVDLLASLNNAPEHLNQILTDSANGRLGFSLNATEHPHFAATRDRRHRLVALALAAVGISWLMGEPGLPSLGSVPAWPFLAAIL